MSRALHDGHVGASRGDNAVLCHVLAHGGRAMSVMRITHPLSKARNHSPGGDDAGDRRPEAVLLVDSCRLRFLHGNAWPVHLWVGGIADREPCRWVTLGLLHLLAGKPQERIFHFAHGTETLQPEPIGSIV